MLEGWGGYKALEELEGLGRVGFSYFYPKVYGRQRLKLSIAYFQVEQYLYLNFLVQHGGSKPTIIWTQIYCTRTTKKGRRIYAARYKSTRQNLNIVFLERQC